MPKMPDEKTLNAARVKLDPVATLTAVVNDLIKSKTVPDFEDDLVSAGLAVKID